MFFSHSAAAPGGSTHTRPGRRRWLGLLAGMLLVTSAVPAAALSVAGPHRAGLQPRQDPLTSQAAAASTTPKPTPTKSSVIQRPSSLGHHASSHTSSTNGTAAATGQSSPAATALPKPFDSSIGNNFTQPACPHFLESLGNNPSFTNCLPLSLMLANSQSFFDDTGTTEGTNAVLDATCDVDANTCNGLMQSLALQLRDPANCGSDYSLGNPQVLQAYNGFISYVPILQAGCLRANDTTSTNDSATITIGEGTGSYCYTLATTPNSAPLNGYIYSLPLGGSLPSGTVNCTTCLRTTMAYFAQAATNATSPMATLYPAAAQNINSQCGVGWVKSNITVNHSTVPNAAAAPRSTWLASLAPAALAAIALAWL